MARTAAAAAAAVTPEGGAMRIYCKLPSGGTTSVDVTDMVSVAELKQRVAAADSRGGGTGCRLLFAGRELEDGMLLFVGHAHALQFPITGDRGVRHPVSAGQRRVHAR